MRFAGVIAGAGAAALLVAAAPSGDDQTLVERTVFETCPQVFAGTMLLTDPAQLAAIGFIGTAPRETPGGKVPRAERGAGERKIVLAGQVTPAGRQCSVWFGGPENAALRKAVVKRAKRDGYSKTPTVKLGDGTGIYQLVRAGPAAQKIVVIEGDGGGELSTTAATTVIYMDT